MAILLDIHTNQRLKDEDSMMKASFIYSSSSSSFFGFLVFLPPCFNIFFLQINTVCEREGYFCFADSWTLSPNSIPLIFSRLVLRLSNFPCVEPVSWTYSLTIKLNTIDVQTINVNTNRYPLYQLGAIVRISLAQRKYPIHYG